MRSKPDIRRRVHEERSADRRRLPGDPRLVDGLERAPPCRGVILASASKATAAAGAQSPARLRSLGDEATRRREKGTKGRSSLSASAPAILTPTPAPMIGASRGRRFL